MSQLHSISPELKQFFVDIQQWINAECPIEIKHFQKYRSLCISLDTYLEVFDLSAQPLRELKSLLEEEFGTSVYPFGGFGTYSAEVDSDIIYKNPERLAFIRKYAAQN